MPKPPQNLMSLFNSNSKGLFIYCFTSGINTRIRPNLIYNIEIPDLLEASQQVSSFVSSISTCCNETWNQCSLRRGLGHIIITSSHIACHMMPFANAKTLIVISKSPKIFQRQRRVIKFDFCPAWGSRRRNSSNFAEGDGRARTIFKTNVSRHFC